MIFIMLTVCIPALTAGEEEIKCVNTQAFRKRFIFLLLHWIYCHNLLAADQVVFGQLNIYPSHHNHFCWKMREMSNKLFQGDLDAEILQTDNMYFLELQ
jgi:hypothetical protein